MCRPYLRAQTQPTDYTTAVFGSGTHSCISKRDLTTHTVTFYPPLFRFVLHPNRNPPPPHLPKFHLPLSPRLIQTRHKPHPLPLHLLMPVPLLPMMPQLLLHLLRLITPPNPDMLPQQSQNLTPLPPLGHRPVRRLERPHRLRPLPGSGGLVHCSVLQRGGLAGGKGDVGLGGPVVNVPVVFVEEAVVFGELGGGHLGEVGGGEGGEEEVGFEGAAFAGLVW